MTIVLSPETQKLLEVMMKAGNYRSTDDVVHAALEALSELEECGLDEETLAAIDRAEDQIECGDVYEWKEVREHVRAEFLQK